MPRPALPSRAPRRTPGSLLGRILGCLLPLLGLFSCASGGVAEGERLRITLLDHQGGQRFELVNETHTPSVEYYSTPRSDAARKVVSDELLAALLSELESKGFAEYSREGRAPSGGSARGRITRSLEVELGDRLSQWSVGAGTEGSERAAFTGCSIAMIEVYNLAQSFQTIENPDGATLFRDPARGRP